MKPEPSDLQSAAAFNVSLQDSQKLYRHRCCQNRCTATDVSGQMFPNRRLLEGFPWIPRYKSLDKSPLTMEAPLKIAQRSQVNEESEGYATIYGKKVAA